MDVVTKKLLAKLVSSSPVVRMYVLWIISRITCYWIPSAALTFITRKGYLQRWRIQGHQKQPRFDLLWHTIKENLFTDVVLQWGINYLFLKIFQIQTACKQQTLTSPDRPSNHEVKKEEVGVSSDASTQDESSDSELAQRGEITKTRGKGWAALRFSGPLPQLSTHMWQILVGYLGFDFMFYWSHRLLHHKKIYKYVHKMHHQYHVSIPFAAAHEHTIESISQLFNWWIPIGFAGWLKGDLHVSTLFFYHCFRWLETVDSHSGFEFPFSPFSGMLSRLVPFFGGARRHDYHHREFDGNYGSTVFWDWLCGTDKDFWKEITESGVLMAGKRILG